MNTLVNTFGLLFREALSLPVRHSTSNFLSGWLGNGKNAPRSKKEGKVYIVGAGPGDVELLTLKALRLIKQADIVLFDALVGKDVIAEIPRHVKREYVGKRCGQHSMKQQDISAKVVELAKAGHCVVRLKGGDPALFARTCEETMALTEANIPFAIVPGITAASGMSAYTGIPLTDRRCAQAVSFITAHFQNPETWPEMTQLAKNVASQTVVVYMGLSRLSLLCEALGNQGIAHDWPVAAVENATSPQQRVIEGTLSTIGSLVSEANVSGPTLLIFGKVIESRQLVNTSLLHNKQHVSAI
ncbi:multifunctional protein [Alteromonas stellipolaris]|uniref:uroporphyrinogen-III C-methyltransferase n=1 Tax=Alteromonas TaxID=226 RepID=UPI0007B433C4|nr:MULTISPECIES: uroporphyrinogen-III C-methyltransferase [Alteromonas]ANB26073.1 multifunctional protein [Alteromonas stellipolaris]MBQ4828867.1 uroporphyrinogen-III C-methyltransferase [Alteromonas sp. MMG017]|mmetsp:Transcript_33648/g.88422  ORF Transcript_33648/g.88422 Transcript_33648/m.88422 type:complete len:300 (+) Transcript_33648:6046-6945(+)